MMNGGKHGGICLFIRLFVLTLAVFLQMAAVVPIGQAKDTPKPVVGWSPNLYTVGAAVKAGDIVDDATQKKIVMALSDKLHALHDADKLPFDLKESSEEYNITHASENNLGIIALVVDDNTIDTQYKTKTANYYKSVVLCGIDVMLCSMDEETNSMRILQTIPLRGYSVLGNDVYHPIQDPISLEQKKAEFIKTAKAMIGEDLNFKQYKRVLREADVKKVSPETYQVTKVNISSDKANELFKDNLPALKGLIAGVFTSKYQQTKDRIVYPSLAEGEWTKDVANNLYSLQLNSPTGSSMVTMPDNVSGIMLDLTGIASGIIPTKKESQIKVDIGYKAWLKKSPVEGKEKAELTKMEIRQFPKQGSTEIEINPQDIYVELLIGLASDLAAQKE